MSIRAYSMGLICVAALLLTQPSFAKLDKQDREKRAQETVHLDGEAKQVADQLIASQRAGWEDHDVETYLASWAEDSVLTWGRSAQPGPHDFRVQADPRAATRRIVLRGENPGTRLRLVSVDVEVDGDTAVLNWQIIYSSDASDNRRLNAERYDLSKTDKGWVVTANRAWVLAVESDGKKTRIDEEEWARRDLAVKQAEADGRHHDHCIALLEAYRFGEAYEAAVAMTEREGAKADAWVLRGITSAVACKAEDIEPAFKKAKAMNPFIWQPTYMRIKEQE